MKSLGYDPIPNVSEKNLEVETVVPFYMNEIQNEIIEMEAEDQAQPFETEQIIAEESCELGFFSWPVSRNDYKY